MPRVSYADGRAARPAVAFRDSLLRALRRLPGPAGGGLLGLLLASLLPGLGPLLAVRRLPGLPGLVHVLRVGVPLQQPRRRGDGVGQARDPVHAPRELVHAAVHDVAGRVHGVADAPRHLLHARAGQVVDPVHHDLLHALKGVGAAPQGLLRAVQEVLLGLLQLPLRALRKVLDAALEAGERVEDAVLQLRGQVRVEGQGLRGLLVARVGRELVGEDQLALRGPGQRLGVGLDGVLRLEPVPPDAFAPPVRQHDFQGSAAGPQGAGEHGEGVGGQEAEADQQQRPAGLPRAIQKPGPDVVEVVLLLHVGARCGVDVHDLAVLLLVHAHDAGDEAVEPAPAAGEEALLAEEGQRHGHVHRGGQGEEHQRDDLDGLLGVRRRLPRAPQQGPLVAPVGQCAVDGAHEVQDGHAARVHHDAEDDGHRLRQPQGERPVGQRVDAVQRPLRHQALAEPPDVERHHDAGPDDRQRERGGHLADDRDEEAGAHGDEPGAVEVVVDALAHAQGVEELHAVQRAPEVEAHEEDQEPRVHQLRDEEVQHLAVGEVRGRLVARPCVEVHEDEQEDLVHDQHGHDAQPEVRDLHVLVHAPVVADQLLLRVVRREPEGAALLGHLLAAEARHDGAPDRVLAVLLRDLGGLERHRDAAEPVQLQAHGAAVGALPGLEVHVAGAGVLRSPAAVVRTHADGGVARAGIHGQPRRTTTSWLPELHARHRRHVQELYGEPVRAAATRGIAGG
mmetsp:Transcript_32632/g.101693  ORF Transcript_32632/g.101693 Transcript_32632/m.101693 type:complete len:733 (+) Transcript_32632:163-2361(+)